MATENTLPITALLAALVTCAKNDIRFYLNGVRIEPTHDGNTNVVGVNGHVLLAVAVAQKWTLPAITVPRTVVEQIGKAKGVQWVTFAAESDDTYTATIGSAKISFAAVGGNFPDWQCVVPQNTEDSGGAAIAVEYVAATAAVAKALRPEMAKGAIINVLPRGSTNAMLFSFGPLQDDSLVTNTIMVVMPMRGYEKPHA